MLLYINQVRLDEESGQARFERSFLRYLLTQKIQVVYVGPKTSQELPGLVFYPINLRKNVVGYIAYQLKLLFIMLRLFLTMHAIETVYIRMNPLMIAPFIALYFYKKRVILRTGPIVPNLSLYNKTKSVMLTRLVRAICVVAYSRANKIVTVTSTIGDWVRNSFNIDGSKIEVIGNGVDVDFFNPDKFSLLPREQVLTFALVATMSHVQGAHLVIMAASKLRARKLVFKIDLIGNGDTSYMNYLKKLIAEQQLENYINLIGHIDYLHVPHAIYTRQIMLAPFTAEEVNKGGSSALKLFEYMAMNRVVVAVRCSDHDFLEKYELGYLYEPDNVDDLASAMEKSLYNYINLEKSLNIRNYCVNHCSSRIRLENYIRLFSV